MTETVCVRRRCMWTLSLAAGMALTIGPQASAQRLDTPLVRETALELALERSPDVRAAEADVEAAEAALRAARIYPYNPELELEAADRQGPDGSSDDRGVRLGQEIEIGGQRGKRIREADDRLAAAMALLGRRRLEVLARADMAYAAAVAAGELRDVEAADVELTENLRSFQQRRLEAGAGTILDLNLARAAAGRATRRLYEAESAWAEARARLAEAIAGDPAAPPTPTGPLPNVLDGAPPLDELTRRAQLERRDLVALRSEKQAAERRLQLERSLALPNLRLDLFSAKEEGDDIDGVALGISLPLFDRNQGGIAGALAERSSSTAAVAVAELAVSREVAAAWSRYQNASRAAATLREAVVGTLEQNLGLLQEAMEAGKVSANDVLILRRELVDGRREQIGAALAAWLARVELELATGGALGTLEGRAEDDSRQSEMEDQQ